MPTAIRDAHPDEAAALSRLALRSKAHWGYDAVFLAACEEALTLTAEQIESDDLVVRVAEDAQGARLGMAAVGLAAKELDMLFVEPRAIGTGIGRELLRDALAQAAARGVEELTIEADPGAEPFYRAQGAERIGERVSTATGRSLPLLRIVTI